MPTRILAGLVFATLLGATLPAPAQATLGVGVTSRSITINESLRPGDSCELPEIGVANTGDEKTTYEVSFVAAPEEGRLDAEPSWFTTTPQVVSPEPGRIEYVGASLSLPPTAAPGDYTAFFVASPVTVVNEGGTPVRLAAGTLVRFTVTGAAAREERGDAEGDSDAGAAASDGWQMVLLALVGITCLASIGFVARNLRVSVRWDRRGGE